jgi:O-antigen/teichoic acid export membrane protein
MPADVSISDGDLIQPHASKDVLATSAAGPAAVRGGALRFLSYVASSLLALGSGALLYRHLGVVDSGRYVAAGSLVALVAAASDLGMTAVAIRELSIRAGDARAQMAHAVLGLRLAVTGAGVLLITAFASIAYDPTLALGVLLAGIGLVLQVWQGTLAIPLMVDMRLGWTSLFDFLRQLFISISIAALVVSGGGLLAFIATPLPAAAAVLALMIVLFRRQLPMRAAFLLSEWRKLVAPVLTYAVAVAAAALYFRVAILLVSLLSSGYQLGYFSLAFNVMAALFTIPGLLVAVAFPIFSRAAIDDHERLAYAIERVFEVCAIIGTWTSLAIALGAQFAVEVLGGSKFAPAAGVLAIQGISVGATFVGTVWGFSLLSLGRYRVILVFNVLALVAVAAAVSALAPPYGATGAAIGTSGVELANAIVGAFLLARCRAQLRPSMRLVPKLVLALAVAAAPALVPVGEPARVALSFVLYAGALLLLRALPVELLALLPVRVGRRSA